jgi:propanol-preferring alcohol dehydrogenase
VLSDVPHHHVSVEPGSVTLDEDESRRPLRPGEARIEVLACGICGTDLHLAHGMRLPPGASYPVRPGHEVCGRVVELADTDDDNDRGIAVGTQVVLHTVTPCAACDLCLSGSDHLCAEARILGIHEPGGLADEVVWPTSRLVAVDGIDAPLAAVLPDAVATAYRAFRIADIAEGQTVCVIGAGGVGTHVLELVRALRPGVTTVGVVGSPASAERLRAAGFDAEVAGDDLVSRLRRSHGAFDVVVEFSGSADAPAQAVRLLRPRGTLVFGSVVDGPLALGPAVAVQTRELTVKGVFSSSLADLEAVVELVREGVLDLSGSVSHTVPLADAPQAFALLASRPAGLVRLVVTNEQPDD